MQPGPLMLDAAGTHLADDEKELLKRPCVGGLILFARNFESVEQLTGLVNAVRAVRPDLLIAVDQEGGRVQRFREGFTRIPPMQQFGNLLQAENTEQVLELVRDCGWLLAAEVLACGVDLSFAPVLDVDDAQCEVIADRSFSPDPDQVVILARAFMQGMHEAGMATTGKHFPGHGGVREDSHLETPYDQRCLEQIKARDLVPFGALVEQLDGVMPAHIVFPNVTGGSVGFSSFWLQKVLRSELGFDGVIFSDDLSMKGADVVGGYPEKARAALKAGCDMILVCNNREGALEVLALLEEQAVTPSPRLPAMKARKEQNWAVLRESPRWQHTRERLRGLLEGR